jgi:hypothetical protein
MGPLLSLASALLVAATPVGPCYVPSDQTAGWKRVDLPDQAPALAAPVGLDQFRSGERVLINEVDSQNVYLGASERHLGRMAYTFRIPKGTYRMELGFLHSLDGAKVDVTAYIGARVYPLLSERRQSGTQLWLDWNVAGVDSLVVEVHHHLREEPVVRHWRVDREVFPAQELAISGAFKASRSLYFWHPGGRRIELCDTPGQTMVLSHWPEGAPYSVTLTRSQAAGSSGTAP